MQKASKVPAKKPLTLLQKLSRVRRENRQLKIVNEIIITELQYQIGDDGFEKFMERALLAQHKKLIKKMTKR